MSEIKLVLANFGNEKFKVSYIIFIKFFQKSLLLLTKFTKSYFQHWLCKIQENNIKQNKFTTRFSLSAIILIFLKIMKQLVFL